MLHVQSGGCSPISMTLVTDLLRSSRDTQSPRRNGVNKVVQTASYNQRSVPNGPLRDTRGSRCLRLRRLDRQVCRVAVARTLSPGHSSRQSPRG